MIGGVTDETDFAKYELAAITDFCRQLGQQLALSGAELIDCSVFEDSADLYAIMGYLDSDAGRAIHLHAPKHESVDERKQAMLKMLGDDGRRLRTWGYPGPESNEGWGQAWLLCQLQALEAADVVFAVGPSLSTSGETLLHLADARRIPIVPLTFLGGAARRAYDRVDWASRYPEVDTSGLHDRHAVLHAVDVANQLVIARAPRRRSDPKTVFISRANADAPFADALKAYIERTGRAALLGDEQVRSDRMVHRAIDDALAKCDVVAVLWSRGSALSPFCSDELEDALDHEREVWLFNLDDSEVVPRRARRLPPYRTHTPQTLVDTARELLDRHGLTVTDG
ncbi:MAG: toll/interleukin-1 receptor domain-containing protein [Solirubrobacteraceae bacterium]